MEKFYTYIKSFRDINTILSKGALIAPPTLAGFSTFSPPWPDNIIAIGFFISILQLVFVTYIFNISNSIKSNLNYYLKWSISIIILSFILYLVSFNFLVKPMENNRLDVIGFLFQYEKFKHYDTNFLLQSNGYDPLTIWVPWSVYLSRIIILLLWILFYVTLSTFFALFYIRAEDKTDFL